MAVVNRPVFLQTAWPMGGKQVLNTHAGIRRAGHRAKWGAMQVAQNVSVHGFVRFSASQSDGGFQSLVKAQVLIWKQVPTLSQRSKRGGQGGVRQRAQASARCSRPYDDTCPRLAAPAQGVRMLSASGHAPCGFWGVKPFWPSCVGGWGAASQPSGQPHLHLPRRPRTSRQSRCSTRPGETLDCAL
jgi:hypothetical protein